LISQRHRDTFMNKPSGWPGRVLAALIRDRKIAID
jgi:hypothetical protein